MAQQWIQKAIKRPGALTKKAQAAGMSPMEFAQMHQHDSGLTGQQSRFAMTLASMREEKKKWLKP